MSGCKPSWRMQGLLFLSGAVNSPERCRTSKKHDTIGLVAMTAASHAEGRQFDPGLVYIFRSCSAGVFACSHHGQRGYMHSPLLERLPRRSRHSLSFFLSHSFSRTPPSNQRGIAMPQNSHQRSGAVVSVLGSCAKGPWIKPTLRYFLQCLLVASLRIVAPAPVAPRPRRHILRGTLACDSVTERLKRWARNPSGSTRRGSSPLAVVFLGALPRRSKHEAVTCATKGLQHRIVSAGGCQCLWKSASAGNRTRVTSMATMYSTTRPLMPLSFATAKTDSGGGHTRVAAHGHDGLRAARWQ